MKKIYEDPRFQIIEFAKEDIIVTSKFGEDPEGLDPDDDMLSGTEA